MSGHVPEDPDRQDARTAQRRLAVAYVVALVSIMCALAYGIFR